MEHAIGCPLPTIHGMKVNYCFKLKKMIDPPPLRFSQSISLVLTLYANNIIIIMEHVLVYTQLCRERVFGSMFKRTETDHSRRTISVRIQHTCKKEEEHICLLFIFIYLLILN